MRILIVLLAIAICACVIVMWLAPKGWETQLLSSIGLKEAWQQAGHTGRILAKILLMFPFLIGLYASLQGWKLFAAYERGQVFSSASIFLLRRLAASLLTLAFLNLVTRSLVSVVLSMNNPPGERTLTVTLSSNDVALLIFGGLLLVIAHIMIEASRLENEYKQIV
jgi:hypothetical protein